MQIIPRNDITVVYDPSELETVEVISDAVERSLHLIQESWGLGNPEDCWVYVMTSWQGFFYQSAPWHWRILLTLTFPFWSSRARRMWPYSAAWTQRYGGRVAIGIKPPRLLEVSDKSIGRLMFVHENEPKIKIQHLTCHELTHACSTHLKLPAWLNEGIAAVTVDRLLEKRTIRRDTLDLLRIFKTNERPPTYRKLSRMDTQAIAYYGVLGYWLVQYLEEVRPGFLKHLFSSPPVSRIFDKAIAAELDIELDGLWSKVPGMIFTHFEMTEPGTGAE